MKKTTLVTIMAATVLTGCASEPTSLEIAKNQIEAEKLITDAAQEKAEQTLNQIPSWVLVPPSADATGIYGVGMGESRKIDIAMKKANINAQFELAKAFGQEMSGNEQNYTKDGLSGTSEQYTQLIDSIVDSIPLSGYETVKQEVMAVDGKFVAYKLSKLTYEQFGKAISMQNAQVDEANIKQAFTDLEARLQERKKAAVHNEPISE